MAILKVANTFHDVSGYVRTQISTPNTYTLFTSDQERFRIDSVGNIGIGTIQPSSYVNNIGLAVIGTNAGTQFAAGSTSSFVTVQGYTGATYLLNNSSNDYYIGTPGAGSLYLRTVGVDRMRLDSAGALGIGTLSPRSQVHVFGLGQQTAYLTDSGPRGGMLRLSENSSSANAGGTLLFGSSQGDSANSIGFAAIKGMLVDGASNTAGYMSFSLRTAALNTSLTEIARLNTDGFTLGSGFGNLRLLGTSTAVSINKDPTSRLDINAVGGLNNVNPFWRGMHLASPDTVFQGATATFPRASFYNTYATASTPTDLFFNIVTGNAGTLPYGIALQGSSAGTVVFNPSGGNVGVGTLTPDRRFTITDTDSLNYTAIGNNAQGLATGTNNGGAIYFGIGGAVAATTAAIESSWGGASLPQIHMGVTRDSNRTRFSAFYDGTLRFYNSNIETARINNSGWMGIGTASPTGTLDVVHSAGGVVSIRGPANDGARLRLTNNLATTNQFQLGQGYNSATDNIGYVMNFAGADVIFGTSGAERLRIKADGRIGINNSNPARRLSVAGDVDVNYFVINPQDATNEGGEMAILGAGSYNHAYIDNYQGNLRFFNLGGKQIYTDGTLNIAGSGGTNYFNSRIQVQGNGAAWWGNSSYWSYDTSQRVWAFGARYNVGFAISDESAGALRMYIDFNGNQINYGGIYPATSGVYDLGGGGNRWRNIYTSDLNLSNSIGDYTIVEGEDDLFLYNNKKGKVYKFALIEVDPNSAPKKAAV